MHADWPEAAMGVTYRELGLAALPRHPRSIRVHLRHLLLICVESFFLGARRTIAAERGTTRHERRHDDGRLCATSLVAANGCAVFIWIK